MELTVEKLAQLYVLDGLKGFGPQKFKSLWDAKLAPAAVLDDAGLLPVPGKTGEKLKAAIKNVSAKERETCTARAERQLEAAHKHGGAILTYWSSSYPPNLLASSHPVPILYTRGNNAILANRRAVACVGSRQIRQPYAELHREFAKFAVSEGFAITSGFAMGADSVGHMAAYEASGQTICVMPGGLDRPFPPENRQMWQSFLASDRAAFVSEFPFGTAASALTLRKRNKVIVALALGVLVSQSSKSGGAMNAFRFAVEQSKSVATFSGDSEEDTSGNHQIGAETKVRAVVFPLQEGHMDPYRQWLQELSSSI